jgi:hypothetical protein
MITVATICPAIFTGRMRRGMMQSVGVPDARVVRVECGDDKEPSVHGKSCALSLKDPKTCKCECGGSLHGSAWKTGASDARATPPRKSKVRRAAAFTVAVTAAGTVGGLAITGHFDSSSNHGNDLSVQVNIGLNSAIDKLSSLGFGGRQISNSGTSGLSHPTDCATSATGLVRQFLARHPCVQYAAVVYTATRQGTSTQVAFSWVEMPAASLATQYKDEVDTYGTGNPPGVSPAFNGHCYASGQQDSTVWTVWVLPTGDINVDQTILQAAAQRTFPSAYLQKHCVI